jgi:glycosyl transferase family 25
MFGQIPLPPIWVINLKRSIDRNNYITTHLNELGLPFELIEGVDGQNLTPKEFAAIYSGEQAVISIGRELSRGEIGCSLSHLKLYQRMIDENLDEALILEDDVVIDSDFFEIIKRKVFFPKDWELILFYHGGTQISFWQRKTFYQHYQFVKFAHKTWGSLSYIIKQSAARKLLAHAYPIRVPADSLTGGDIRTGVRLYGINPPCMQQLFADDPNFTTMPERNLLRRKTPSKTEMSKFVCLLYLIKTRLVNLYRGLNPRRII